MDKFRTQMGERPPVILEIGSLFTKLGVSDDNMPRRTIFTPQNLRSWLLTGDNSQPQSRNITKLEHDIEAFIRQVFIHELLLNPRDRPLIFCEDTFMPREFVEAFAKVILTRFNIPKVYFFYSMVLPMYTSSSFTGIVVDCGYQDIQILPIYEGYPLREGYKYLPGGGKQISAKLKECLLNQNLGLQADILDDSTLENIKVKYLSLLLKNQKEAYLATDENIQKMKEKLFTVEIDKKKIKISYFDRVTVLESLFGNPENEDVNIATGILDSVLQVNTSSKKKVTQCIVLSGGLTMIPNFAKRLRQELCFYLNHSDYKDLAPLAESFAFIDVKYPTNNLTWIGASILSTLPGIDRFAVTADSTGAIKVPDRFGENYLYASPPETIVNPSEKSV